MNNPNIRKRRPYGHGDSPAVPIPQDSTYSLSASALLSRPEDFSAHDLQILEQAASILNCPVPQLLGLYNRTPHPQQYPLPSTSYPVSTKRPRLSADMTSVSPQEKSLSPPPSAQDRPERQHAPEMSNSAFPLPLSTDRSRITQYFANFSICPPCTTCEPQVYDPIPVSSPYAYAPGRQYFDDKPSSPGSGPGAVSPDQPNIFLSNTPSTAPPMMPNYPILQPNQPMSMQPSTSGEGMVYPEIMPNPQYFNQSDFSHGVSSSMSGNTTENQSYSPPLLVHNVTAEKIQSQEVDRNQNSNKSGGLNIVHQHHRPPTARRGPFKTNDQREKTAETRRIGSCIRCRMQRIRCETNPTDKLGTCLTCLKVINTKIWRMPCLRYKITDVKLFKPGNVKGYEWTRRWIEGIAGDISQWASMETRVVKVTEGYTEQAVELRVRQFIPQEGDKLERSWVHEGNRKRVKIPPYAIVNLEEAKNTYTNYIRKGLPECCHRVVGKERFLLATYGAAIRASKDQTIDPKESALLRKALQLWMAIRLTTKSTIIVGDETLGMPTDIMDETSPLRGCIPLPPVMGAQIELILIHQIQSSLRREMLENLQAMTQANKHQTWFTTYLITFILLHNVALLCQHDAGYARKHGIKLQSRFAREEMVREYQMGKLGHPLERAWFFSIGS
ncbi:hypothetical protein F5Y11DRAFT_209978 [Daldinia sp. FL1419]|nr:hypothetical protein F5Y11DRAFT_209978 [Daldinia sp. FL1419]